MKPMYSTFHIS